MPITLTHNPYRGVNAHLHSRFQSPRGPQWMSFHRSHIALLMIYLNSVLPRPYRAFSENSLQIQISGGGPDDVVKQRVPDVTIYKGEGEPSVAQVALAESDRPNWQTVLTEAYPLLDDIPAVVIYRTDNEPYIPVTRIELLSPSNMSGGIGQEKYETNRLEALHSGLPLVEINYLHEYHPPIRQLPVYPEDENSFPYRITITDPRLSPPLNAIQSWGFGVDRPFPKLPLPLGGTDRVLVDFTEPYNRTFEGGRWGDDVDNAQEPERMETYRDDDQAAIRARMAAVVAGEHESPS
jgi:hypothetical protein